MAIWIPDAARRRPTTRCVRLAPRYRSLEAGSGMVTIRTTPTYTLQWSASDLADLLGLRRDG